MTTSDSPALERATVVRFADTADGNDEPKDRRGSDSGDYDEMEQANALHLQDLEMAKAEELRRQQQREQQEKEDEEKEEEEKKKKEEEERERRERERREEEERQAREAREKAEAEERELQEMRERVKQMLPTHDQSKQDTIAKVQQLKERMNAAKLQSAGGGSETPEERHRRQREERARRVREFAQKCEQGVVTATPNEEQGAAQQEEAIRMEAEALASSPPSKHETSPAVSPAVGASEEPRQDRGNEPSPTRARTLSMFPERQTRKTLLQAGRERHHIDDSSMSMDEVESLLGQLEEVEEVRRYSLSG